MSFYETCNAAIRDAMARNAITNEVVDTQELEWDAMCDGHMMIFNAGKVVAEMNAVSLTDAQNSALGLPINTVAYWIDVTEYNINEFYDIGHDKPQEPLKTERHTFLGYNTAKQVWSALAGCYDIEAP